VAKSISRPRSRIAKLFPAVLLLCTFARPLTAQEWKSNPRELIRRAIANQDKPSAKATYYKYRDVKRKKDGSTETKEMLQTPQLVLGRIVARNGEPLSPEQRKNEESRLNRLTKDPNELNKKKKEQHDDDERARMMVRAIPDAFNFQYTGSEEGPSGEIAVFKFSPNPNWDPPNRELQVFTGMSGTLKIAVRPEMLTLIQATLFQDVNFGWGILGKLYKGGDFLIEQSEVAPAHWDITHMKLHFTGKILLFKSLNIQQDETTSNYKEVQPMSVAQALDRLRELDGEYAKNAAANGGK
jgi:hypothetical protein